MTIAARRVQAYEATLVSLTPDHIERMHELAMTVGWAHRAEDLTQLLELGEGVLAIDAIGRAIGSAMWFKMGDDMAAIGAVMTVPPLQSSGVGRWLMEEAIAAIADRGIRLVATRSAYHLDYSLGFRPCASVTRYQGHLERAAPVAPPTGTTIRAMTDADIDAMVAFDANVNGGSRNMKLRGIAAVSRGVVAERDSQPCGFALCRSFGRGRFIGPLEADSAATATAMMSAIIADEPDGYMRIDLLHDESHPPPTELTRFAQASGMISDESYTLMTRDAPTPMLHSSDDRPVMYAMMSQSLG